MPNHKGLKSLSAYFVCLLVEVPKGFCPWKWS